MNKNRFFMIAPSANWGPLFVLTIAVLFVSGVSLACNAPASDDQALRDTQIALNVQATQIAMLAESSDGQLETQSALTTELSQTAEAATQIVQDVQATINAQAADSLPPTQTPQPTATDSAPADLAPTDSPPENPPLVAEPVDIEELMKDSKILLFENVTKIPLPRYIQQALDNLGFSRNYVDTKDAIGNFKAELLSGTDWDLIVVGVEARSAIQGEFFDYFNEQVNKGTGLVLEIWNLDEIAGAKATSFLSNCGIQVQGDWYDPPLTARSIWWLYGEHPVFHEPNEGMSLVNYNPYWAGDAGDLLKISSGSEATMLAGTYAQEKSSYGVLAICHEDRVIVQTYSSHDYRQDDVVRLWENYIYNTLRAHFEYETSQ
jgi:hypothetical protein